MATTTQHSWAAHAGRRLHIAAAALLATTAMADAAASAATSQPPALEHLTPGGKVQVALDIPINVVFVGLEEGPDPTGIDTARLLAAQPDVGKPMNQRDLLAGGSGEFGLEYRYDVRTVFADAAFEDAFFGYLASAAYGPFVPTGFQAYYSGHPLAGEDIIQNWVLNATAVESWLIEHAPALPGVDTSRPTVFYINWYGRADFRFHTYAYFVEQPEVEFFAASYHHTQMSAWGGGTPDHPQAPVSDLGRVWFYDVSAGPDYASTNWWLDTADLDGDGVADERFAPIWEYGTAHWYRPFVDLTADLAKVLRFVAIDLLFTTSPLFDAGSSPPLFPEDIEVDLNVFADLPGHDPFQYLLVDELVRRLSGLDPSRAFSADAKVHEFTPALDRAYDCASTAHMPRPTLCYPGNDGGYAVNDLFHWTANHENTYLDGRRGEVPVAIFDVGDDRGVPLFGISSGRWNLVWTLPFMRRGLGASPTWTTSHEVAHHLALAHPHDGYDFALGKDILPTGPFYFAWLGDCSATPMSYMRIATDFSQFDRDNLDRWLTVVRLQGANDVLGQALASPRAGSASSLAQTADQHAGLAIDRLHAWDLRGASVAALDAYRAALTAAAEAGVHVEPWSPQADVSRQGPWWAIDSLDAMQRPLPPGMEPLR